MTSTRLFLENSNSAEQLQFQNYLKNRTGIDSIIQSLLWLPVTPNTLTRELEVRALKNGFLGYRVIPAPQPDDELPYFLSQASLPVLFVSPRFEGSDYLGHRFELNEGEA